MILAFQDSYILHLYSFAVRKLTYQLALVLTFALPWEDSISIPNLGSLARLMGFGVAGLWLGTIVIEGKFRKPNLFHALVFLFFLWNFLSVFWSPDLESTIQRVKTYSQIFLLMLIYWEVFQKPENLSAGLQAYVYGSYVLVANTIYNYMAGNAAAQYEIRYSATGVNAVDMALILILGLPISTSIALRLFSVARRNVRDTLLQLIFFLYIPLAIFSIVLTGSRTSLVAIIPFIIYLITTQLIKIDRKIFILVILLVSLFVLLPFVPQSVIQRLGTISTSIGERDLGGRVNLWMAGIAALAQHPILGVGSGAMDYSIGAWVHNTFISIASETGFIGFLLFLSILGLVVYKLLMLPQRVSEMWLTMFITWAIGVLSLSWESRKITWILLSFIVIESSFREQSIESEEKMDLSESIKPSLKQVKHA